jgi:phospholipid/cholesterol/gamma-HCH transport system permease protein
MQQKKSLNSMNQITGFVETIGSFVMFQIAVMAQLPLFKKRFFEIVTQMKRVGFDSILLISITSAFTGLVTSVQASYQTSGYIPKNLIGVLVAKSTMIELAPVLTGLVLAGKVGASMAAEIGSMKVSEQIDALKTMAINPLHFIYLPRMLAGLIMVPVVTIYSIAVSIFSAFFLSVGKYNVNAYSFFTNIRVFFKLSDLWGGLIKAAIFGYIITTVACYCGSKTEGGAEGVGKATTGAVIYSSILILIMDFLVAAFLFGDA